MKVKLSRVDTYHRCRRKENRSGQLSGLGPTICLPRGSDYAALDCHGFLEWNPA